MKGLRKLTKPEYETQFVKALLWSAAA